MILNVLKDNELKERASYYLGWLGVKVLVYHDEKIQKYKKVIVIIKEKIKDRIKNMNKNLFEEIYSTAFELRKPTKIEEEKEIEGEKGLDEVTNKVTKA